jgi:SSS family solute:Na+ symporter
MPDAQLSPPDLAIVAAYVAGMMLLGLWFSRKQAGLKSYFVGDRDVGWFLVLVSIVATETSAVTFLSVPGTAYNPAGGNFTFVQLAFGYILGRCLVAWLLLPMYMRGELFSAYQVLEVKFGRGVQRVASGIFLLTRTVADGLRLYLTALVMQYVGWGIEWAIVAVGVVTILYTYLGGMKAVLWTDLIQFCIKIAGAALAFVFVIKLLPGGWDEYVSVGDAAGKFRWLDAEFRPDVAFNIWAGVIGGAALSMASHGADQLMVQRYLCAKSLTQARVAVVLSGFVVLAQFVLFLGLGVGLYAATKAGVFAVGDSRNDAVFGLFIVTKLPVGVVGVLVAALLAAAMSTLSSSLNSSANALVTDFYKPLRPGRPEGHYVFASRLMTAGWGVAQIAVALVAHWTGGSQSVVSGVLTVAGFTTGLVLGLFLLGMLRHTVRPGAAIAGLVAGFLAVSAVWVPSLFGPPILAWPWFALLGAGVTVAAALATDRLGRQHAAV